MKVHEENKLMSLLMLDYTEEQAERIVACITSIYTDESDIEELVYKIDNNLDCLCYLVYWCLLGYL